MKITAIEFTDEEKTILKNGFINSALSEEKCFCKKGHEFEFDKDNYPFLENMLLFFKINIYNEYQIKEPPDHDELIARSVLEIKFSVINEFGEEVKTNLDYDFENEVTKELTI